MSSKRLLVATALLLGFCSTLPLMAHNAQKRYPHVGRFRYDGGTFASIYFTFHNPGGWTVANPGLEIDLDLKKDFFQSADPFNTSCTSWSNLPDYYDDCGTAGILEDNSAREAFGFGTYSAQSIQANYEYTGWWSFVNDSVQQTDFAISWQEVQNNCPLSPKSIWCMGGTGGYSRLTEYDNLLTKGTVSPLRWTWTDYFLASGGWRAEPEGSSYCSVAGKHVGNLSGPSGTDFDLYLFKWNGSSWVQVARADSTSTNEKIVYSGTSGCYLWNVNAYQGSGSYQIGLSYPSPTSNSP